jgi:hypothetical protein
MFAFLVFCSLQNGLMSAKNYEITQSYILDTIIMYWEVHYSKGNDLSYRIIMNDTLVTPCISCINSSYVAKFLNLINWKIVLNTNSSTI